MEPQAKSSEKRDSPENAVPESKEIKDDLTAKAEVPLPATLKPAAAQTGGASGPESPTEQSSGGGAAGSQGGPPPLQPDGMVFSRSSQSLISMQEVVLFVSGFGSALTDETFAQLFSTYGKVVSCKVLIDIPTGKSKGCGLIRMENKKAADAAIAGLNGTTLQGQVTSLTVKIADTPEEKNRRRQRQLMNQRFNPMARGPVPYGMMMPGQVFPSVVAPTYGAAATTGYPSYPVAAAAGGAYPQQQSFQQLQMMQEAAAHATVPGQFTLYVGGLPQGVDEGSLYKMFSPYGAVAGVKVVMDQQNPTMNRGFAFVNFFRYEEACQAIYALHNQQFGDKRLQVSFKTAPKSKQPGAVVGTVAARPPGAAAGGYTGPAAGAAAVTAATYGSYQAAAYGTGAAYQSQYAAPTAAGSYGGTAAASTSAASYQQYPYGGSYQ